MKDLAKQQIYGYGAEPVEIADVFSGESNSIEDVITEVNEIIRKDEDVILLIDKVNKFVNADFTLNYINSAKWIVVLYKVSII